MSSLPRVILIGGAPLSGKTTLARAIAQELGYAHIATDDLSTAIRAVTDADSHPALHYLEVDGSFRDYYRRHDPERLLEDALAYHRAAWPAIEAVIRAHAGWGEPAVIEGWGILPDLAKGLGLDQVASLLLIPEADVYEARCRADVSFWQGAADEEGLITSFARRSRLFGEHLAAAQAPEGSAVIWAATGAEPNDVLGIALHALGIARDVD